MPMPMPQSMPVRPSRPRRVGPLVAMAGGALLALLLGGCASWRVVLEPVPPPDALEERVVLEAPRDGASAARSTRDRIALIEVEGLIADAPGGLLGNGRNPIADLARELEKAADDPRVKAVVLRVNSRGGTVTGSDMAHREVRRFRERTGKPVIVLLGEVAASGGYYLACAGDVIIAHPTTITGSIGVITQTVQVGAALERLGVVADAVVSGPNKAMASPLGRPDRDHRDLLQEMVDDFYDRFVQTVRDARPGIDPADFPLVTDGRVVTGRRALELGLVDAVGDAHDAFALARERGGAAGARLVRYVRPGARSSGVYADGRARAGAGADANAGDGSAGIEINLLRLDGPSAAFLPATHFLYVWGEPVR